MTKINMFTGKGGVGKTTMSVASALHHSKSGKTLLISTDPSGSLSEVFGQSLDQEVITVAENLDAVELTRTLVLDLWRRKFADEIYLVLSSFLPVGREIIDYIEGAPGIDEEFMLDYLVTMAQSGDYKTIIWDTAPTVSTLNLLFIQQLFYTHLTQAQKIYMKVKSVFSGVDPLSLIDKWLRLTAQIIETLRTDTSAWIVANPESLPVGQALDIADALSGFGIDIDGYILNKVLPFEVCKDHPFWQRKYTAQQKCRDKLSNNCNNRPIKEIPESTGAMRIDGFLGEIARLLYG